MNMPKTKIFFVLAVSILFIVSCSPAASPATPATVPAIVPTIVPTGIVENTSPPSQSGIPLTEAEVPRVSVEDTVAAIQSGEAIVVDVRSAEAYQASHIPGAISIPLGEVETSPNSLNLDKDQWIVTYCT